MSRRFSRIRDAARLSQAVANYRAWDAEIRPRNVGNGTARGPSVALYLDPFGRDLEGNLAQVRCTQEARAQMGTAIGLHVLTAPGTGTARRESGFTPAKVVLKIVTGNGVETVSRITGLSYLKYAGSTYSHPYGRATATDVEFDEFNQIRATLLAAGGSRNVSYKPEIWKQV